MPKEKLPPSIGRATDLSQRFPQASASFLRLNGYANIPPPPAAKHPDHLPLGDTPPAPQPKRRARARALAKGKAEEGDSRFYVVRVTSIRKRLIDTDNLVPKWHVDSLRYAGILPDDAPERARIETSQRKIQEGEEEHTQISITIQAQP